MVISNQEIGQKFLSSQNVCHKIWSDFKIKASEVDYIIDYHRMLISIRVILTNRVDELPFDELLRTVYLKCNLVFSE